MYSSNLYRGVTGIASCTFALGLPNTDVHNAQMSTWSRPPAHDPSVHHLFSNLKLYVRNRLCTFTYRYKTIQFSPVEEMPFPEDVSSVPGLSPCMFSLSPHSRTQGSTGFRRSSWDLGALPPPSICCFHTLLSPMNPNYVSHSFLPTSSVLLPLFLFLLRFHYAFAFVEVTASNSSITYFGDWVVQNGGLYRYTAQAGAFASLTFQGNFPRTWFWPINNKRRNSWNSQPGTSISWFGDKDPNGGLASVQVDNDSPTTVDVSAGMAKGQDTQVAALFTKSGLDGNSQHTITISWAGDSQGIYITLFYFQLVSERMHVQCWLWLTTYFLW